MRHHLQGHALAAALAKLDHGLDAPKPALGFDIGVVADGNGSMAQANAERALGSRSDVFARCCGGEVAIRRGGAFERPCGILDQASCARFVQMLVRVDQSRHNELVGHVDGFFRAHVRDCGSHRNDATICADCDIERFRPRCAEWQYAASRQ